MKNKKRLIYWGIPAALLISLGTYYIKNSNAGNTKQDVNIKKAAVLPVSGIIAQYKTNSDGIQANGTLLANEEVDLVAEITGKVVGIYFQEGKAVKKGDMLLKVDDADLQAQLSRSEFQKKLLTEKLERQRILLQRESISREAFDQLQTDYNVLEADIALLKVKISRTEIKAPFDGTMGFRYVSEGSYVQPSSKIARIVDNNVLKFEFSIPERYADKELLGKDVKFNVTGKTQDFTAKVYAIDPMVDVNTRAILLRAKYDNNNHSLLPGMFAQGSLVFDEAKQFLPVPSEAVVPEMDGKRLWVLKNGKARSISVETESRDQKNVSVISGIEPGDTILTGGLMQLRDGASVDVKL
ncbi:MAG: efflux RND transporter periplasmic adaptor subunit [Bacteroidales bacterium]|nr:efflux RND transporter periplasmic adaptor subunit [Bacteroidales bacterium]